MTSTDKATINKQFEQAFQLLNSGKRDEAQAVFHQIANLDVKEFESMMQLGNLAMHLEENFYAAGIFAKLLEDYPDHPQVMFYLANASFKLGKTAKASELLYDAIGINPNMTDAYVILGELENNFGNYYKAIELLEKAIELKPSNPAPYFDIIISLRAINRFDDAYKYAKKLLRMQKNALNYASMSRVLIELGKQDEAIDYLEKAIDIDKSCGIAYHDLATIKKFTPDDQKLIDKYEKALKQSLPASQRSIIQFGLGKIYNDCKEYEKAFEHYRLANSLVKDAVEPVYVRNCIKKIKKTFSKKLLKYAEDKQLGSDSELPVFIIGMPRSGTTLIEQIIASHPQGEGAGELIDIQLLGNQNLPDDRQSFAEMSKLLTKEFVDEQCEHYLNSLTAGRKDASRIVDKMPVNFAFLGMIHVLFPKARIIHALRNPLDICLSCYFQSLRNIPASFDFNWIANEYRMYRKTVEYWRGLLPEGKIADVHYEDLIQDPETQIRRLIDICGLEWDPTCLEFYNSKRAIGTASLWQARQPIYSSSRKRWVNYASHLGELANGLSDYLDEEDIAELGRHGARVRKKWKLGFGG